MPNPPHREEDQRRSIAELDVSLVAIIPIAGRLSDRFGRRPVYLVGAVAAGTWGFFAFPMMDSKENWVILSAIIIGLVFHAFMYAAQPAIMAEMFPTRIRYTSMSLPYHIGNGWFGGFLPLIAASIVVFTGDIYAGLWYPIAIALLSLVVGVLVLDERRERDLEH